jgi:hypothetical protein
MIAAYYLDDCCGETTEQSTMPAQMVATETTIEKLGEVELGVDGVATATPDEAEDVPVGAIAPREDAATSEYSTLTDDEPTVAETTQVIAPQPGVENEAMLENDDVTVTGRSDAGDVPVGAIAPRDESPSFEYSTRSDDQLTVDDIVALIEGRFDLPLE